MAILDAALGSPNSQATRTHSRQLLYDRHKDKYHDIRYIEGLIGEREGRKWLEKHGYEVYEFAMVHNYFESLDSNALEITNVFKTMRRRRKQDYIKNDLQLIVELKEGIAAQARSLKVMFGSDYIAHRRFFIALGDNIGQRQPDFFVKKGNLFALVEVKSNTSQLSPEQRDCFQLAERFGVKAHILKVSMESNEAKHFDLPDYKSRKTHQNPNAV
jgi:hypothetical protein